MRQLSESAKAYAVRCWNYGLRGLVEIAEGTGHSVDEVEAYLRSTDGFPGLIRNKREYFWRPRSHREVMRSKKVADRILELLERYPRLSRSEIAKAAGTSVVYVARIKSRYREGSNA